MDALTNLFHQFLGDILYLTSGASSRTYWPYLATAIPLALVLQYKERHAPIGPEMRTFSAATWTSRSALNDYAIICANSFLFILCLRIFLPNIDYWINTLSSLLRDILPPMGDTSVWWAPPLFALSLFVVDDFLRFFSHYIEHRVPILWEFHKVHHSATVLNFLTAERHHPLASLFERFVSSLGIITVNAVFIALFGDKISPTGLLGGNIFWLLYNILAGTLRHSPAWVSFGPRIERWFISPAQHQIHHSENPLHFDRNFGSTLAIWDRLFGTLHCTTSRREVKSFGIGDETPEYTKLSSLLCVPMRKAFQILVAVPTPTANVKS